MIVPHVRKKLILTLAEETSKEVYLQLLEVLRGQDCVVRVAYGTTEEEKLVWSHGDNIIETDAR